MPIPGTAAIGLQWGDEAKGKLTDAITDEHDIGGRFNGADNAGHRANGVDFHAIPSSVIRKKLAYIASGCGVNFPGLLRESRDIESKKKGVNVRKLLHISPQASIIQPHQILSDIAEAREIGTTNKGIGPHYSDKARRMAGDRRVDLRVGELLHYPEDVFRMMRRNLKAEIEKLMGNKDFSKKEKNKILENFGPNKKIDECREAVSLMGQCIDEDPYWLSKRYYRDNMRILLEGAQAEGLDLVRGTTPYVTSSRTGLYAALDATSLPRKAINRIFGVGKLVTSRVGWGPFVSEFGGRRSELHCMKDGGKAHTKLFEANAYADETDEMLASGNLLQIGKALRFLTDEYGVTSKRPRRIGAFDAVQFAQAAAINEVTHVVLSKLDCMNIFAGTQDGMIPIVTGYELDGKKIDYIPTDERVLRKVRPIFSYVPAFKQDITNVRHAADLPREARYLLKFLHEQTGRRVSLVGVGPAPDQLIEMNGCKILAA
jgi:adenylosuccinate synthase